MILHAAYYAGWRAGMSRPRIQYLNGNVSRRGVKTLLTPACPLRGVFSRMAWELGCHAGMVQKLNTRKGF